MSTPIVFTKSLSLIFILLSMFSLYAMGVENSSYPEVLKEYSTLMQSGQAQQEMDHPAAISKWIERFEAELSKNVTEHTPHRPLMMKILGDLYAKSGSFQAANELYLSLINDKSVNPDMRLTAAENNFSLAIQSGSSPQEMLAAHNQLKNTYEAIKQKQPTFSQKSAEFVLYISEMLISRQFATYGEQQAKQLYDEGKRDEAIKTLIRFEEESLEWMRKFQNKIEASPEKYAKDLKEGFWDRTAILFNSAKLASEISEKYASLDQNEQAETYSKYAVQQLELLVGEYPNTLFTRNGGALLAKVKSNYLKGEAYVEYVKQLAGKIEPGHEYISALMEIGLKLSSNNNSLVTANHLYDLVVDLEKRWFPEEYKDHVNYQWALLEKVSNLIQLNDIQQAAQLMNELESLILKGEYFNKMFDKYKRLLDKFGVYLPHLEERLDSELQGAALFQNDTLEETEAKISEEHTLPKADDLPVNLQGTTIKDPQNSKQKYLYFASASLIVLGSVFYVIRKTKRRIM